MPDNLITRRTGQLKTARDLLAGVPIVSAAYDQHAFTALRKTAKAAGIQPTPRTLATVTSTYDARPINGVDAWSGPQDGDLISFSVPAGV